MQDTPILWQFRFSHFNEKARWALDYKGIPHHRHAVMPGLHVLPIRQLTGDTKIPVLQIGDEIIPDSTRILEEVDARWPSPPLYPADPEMRREAAALEHFFDEEVGWYFHAALFHICLDHAGPVVRTLTMGFPVPLRAASRGLYPVFKRIYRRRYDISPERGELGRQKLRTGLDRIARELGDGDYLVGDAFSVADLTAASLLFALAEPAERQYTYPEMPREWQALRAAFADHPAVDWIREMYRRHRGRSHALSDRNVLGRSAAPASAGGPRRRFAA